MWRIRDVCAEAAEPREYGVCVGWGAGSVWNCSHIPILIQILPPYPLGRSKDRLQRNHIFWLCLRELWGYPQPPPPIPRPLPG